MILARIGYSLELAGSTSSVALGSSASFVFTARGGLSPYLLSMVTEDLPAEWTYQDNGDGTFTVQTGNTLVPGNFDFTIRVTDSNRIPVDTSFSLRVIALPLEITGTLDDMTVGTPYSDTLTVSNGTEPYEMVLAYALPAGVGPPTLAGGDSSPMTIAGTPTGVGLGPGTAIPFEVSVSVQDSSDPPQVVEFLQDIIVNVPAVVASFSSLPDGELGVAYTGDANATGGTGGYTFTKQAGPSWMSVNSSSGAITGTPDSSGSGITVTVRATDTEGNFDDVTDTINITSTVVSLLHLNGSQGSQTYTDETGKTWADEGAGGGASEISTVQSVFGGASLSLNSGGYIRGPTSSDWAFGTGNFEFKFRVRFNALGPSGSPANTIVSNYNASTGITIQYRDLGSGYALIFGEGDTPLLNVLTTLSLNTWYAICIARSGTSLKMFLDGTQIASATDSTNHAQTTPMMIGRLRTSDTLHYCDIYLDEFRVLKGGTVQTANYTPESSEFPDP